VDLAQVSGGLASGGGRHHFLAATSRSIAIICSSLNWLRFIVRPLSVVGLYPNLEEF
jgi:hypothetical protein